ncbi:MAG: TRAP transporter small permease [Alphaproteobacteria bacterium]|nr:TRAP transporter small permease [Alphaproteobacteria bacterium]MDX5464671.1 TRAP transporter small permease [Alphaproteobacteria bacterium]
MRDPMSRFSATLGEWMAPLFLVAVLISVYEVVLRYAFNAPTVWVHELTVLLSAACFVVSGLYALEREEHIRVTVISDRLPRPARRAVALLNIGLAMVFLLAIVWGGWSHAWEALSNWHRTRTAFNSPTPAILKPLIVLTAAAMVLQILVNWRRNGPNR